MEDISFLDKLIIGLLCLSIVLSGTFIDYSYFLASIIIISLIRTFKDKDRILTIKKQNLPLYFFFLLMPITILIGGFYARNFTGILEYLSIFILGFLLCFVCLIILNNNKKIEYLMKIYIFFAVLISLSNLIIYFVFYFTGNFENLLFIDNQGARSIGFYNNPNYYAVSVLIAVSFMLGLYKTTVVTDKKLNKIKLIIYAVLTFDLFLTISRGAIITYILVNIIFLVSEIKIKKINIRKLLLKFTGYSIITVGVFSVMLKSGILELVNDRFIRGLNDGGSGRVDLWGKSLDIFGSEIFFVIFGVGGKQIETYTEFHIENTIHNSYLRFLLETGIIGFIVLILFLVLLSTRVFSIKKFIIISPMFFAFLSFIFLSLTNDMFLTREFYLIVALIFCWKINISVHTMSPHYSLEGGN